MAQEFGNAAPEGVRTNRILVADDEEIIREMLFAYLTEEGYDVDMAVDGPDAIAKIRAGDYDVVITDIRLPGCNGMEVVKSAKAELPDCGIIVMTAFSTEDLAIEAVRLGAYDYLKKPVDDLGLFALLVKEILEKQALSRENVRLVENLKVRNDELNNANAKLLSMATTDPLTGAYNRRYILARLEHQFQQTLRYGEPFTVVMLDIDHFKKVNDTYGHQVGDEVLKHFAEVVRKLIRGTDLFGRYGGEEFLLLLHGAAAEDALRTSERLRRVVSESPLHRPDESIQITVSVGLMSAPDRALGCPEDMVKRADEALYRAKNEGRNRVVVSEPSTPGVPELQAASVGGRA